MEINFSEKCEDCPNAERFKQWAEDCAGLEEAVASQDNLVLVSEGAVVCEEGLSIRSNVLQGDLRTCNLRKISAPAIKMLLARTGKTNLTITTEIDEPTPVGRPTRGILYDREYRLD